MVSLKRKRSVSLFKVLVFGAEPRADSEPTLHFGRWFGVSDRTQENFAPLWMAGYGSACCCSCHFDYFGKGLEER